MLKRGWLLQMDNDPKYTSDPPWRSSSERVYCGPHSLQNEKSVEVRTLTLLEDFSKEEWRKIT